MNARAAYGHIIGMSQFEHKLKRKKNIKRIIAAIGLQHNGIKITNIAEI